MTDAVTIRDVTVTHTDDEDADDAPESPECDHKRHTAAFADADCCYACFEEVVGE